jgi:carbonic anhydrase
MPSLIPVDALTDILPKYRGTPIERFLRYHNLGEPLPPSTGRAELLIGMCMDHRKDLTIPNEFAYVLRSAGGNLRDSAFEISYAVGIGGIGTVALLAHTDCGMAHVTEKRAAFVRGLVERGGWEEQAAVAHFTDYATRYEIGDPIEFVVSEAARLRQVYPRLMVAPLLYAVENDRLVQINETVEGQAEISKLDESCTQIQKPK